MRFIFPLLGILLGLALIVVGAGEAKFVAELIQAQNPAGLYGAVQAIGIGILAVCLLWALIRALRRKRV